MTKFIIVRRAALDEILYSAEKGWVAEAPRVIWLWDDAEPHKRICLASRRTFIHGPGDSSYRLEPWGPESDEIAFAARESDVA